MKLTVVNAGSKTVSSVLRHLWAKPIPAFKSVTLLDLYPTSCALQNALEVKGAYTDPSKVSLEKLENLYFLQKEIASSDFLLYFTHGYSQNVVCKNKLLDTISAFAEKSEKLQRSLFVNLAEFFQTNDDQYLESAVAIENEVTAKSSKASVLWSDYVYDKDHSTSLLNFLKHTKKFRLPKNAGDQTQKWTDAEKLADAIALFLNEKLPNQRNYLTNTDEINLVDFLKSLSIKNEQSLIDYAREDIITDFTSKADYRNYLRLFGHKLDLQKSLEDYKPLSVGESYEKLSNNAKSA